MSSASPIDSLVDLACRDGVDIRPTLLRVLTDLYVQKPSHTPEEEAQYVELAGRLIDEADAPTRAAVHARLCSYSRAPLALLRRLALPPVSAEARAEMPPEHELGELFFSASSEERRLILTNLEPVAAHAARRPPAAESEVIRRLENAALARNTGEFARMLERALGINIVIAERITRDHFGEPIVVAAKVLGMRAEVLQRILLFLNPVVGQSVQRVYELAQLFDEMTPASAAEMVSIWQRAYTRAKHAPAAYDDERKGARAASEPARNRAPQRDVLSSRKSNAS
jgi:hypothetical protein